MFFGDKSSCSVRCSMWREAPYLYDIAVSRVSKNDSQTEPCRSLCGWPSSTAIPSHQIAAFRQRTSVAGRTDQNNAKYSLAPGMQAKTRSHPPTDRQTAAPISMTQKALPDLSWNQPRLRQAFHCSSISDPRGVYHQFSTAVSGAGNSAVISGCVHAAIPHFLVLN